MRLSSIFLALALLVSAPPLRAAPQSARMTNLLNILKKSEFSVSINKKTTLTSLYRSRDYEIVYFEKIYLSSERAMAELIVFYKMKYSHDYVMQSSYCHFSNGYILCNEPLDGMNIRSKVAVSDIIKAKGILISGDFADPWRGKKRIFASR